MATISNPGTVARLLAEIQANPRKNHHVEEIWEYLHRPSGEIKYAVFAKAIYNDLEGNPFVAAKCLLWSKPLGFWKPMGTLAEAVERKRQEAERERRRQRLAPHLRRKPREGN